MEPMVNLQAQSSPAATAELGRRALAHLGCLMRTRSAETAGGPSEMYKVIGSCAQIADLMRPSLYRIGELLAEDQTRGKLVARQGPFTDDTSAAIDVTKRALADAAFACDRLYEALERAQMATADISSDSVGLSERHRNKIAHLFIAAPRRTDRSR